MAKTKKMLMAAAQLALIGREHDKLEVITPPNGRSFVMAHYHGAIIEGEKLYLVGITAEGTEVRAPLLDLPQNTQMSLEKALKNVKHGKNGFFAKLDAEKGEKNDVS